MANIEKGVSNSLARLSEVNLKVNSPMLLINPKYLKSTSKEVLRLLTMMDDYMRPFTVFVCFFVFWSDCVTVTAACPVRHLLRRCSQILAIVLAGTIIATNTDRPYLMSV